MDTKEKLFLTIVGLGHRQFARVVPKDKNAACLSCWAIVKC